MPPGVTYVVLSVLCFAVVNTCVKAMPAVPVQELIFFRSVTVFAGAWWFIRKNKITFWGNNKVWLATRGITGVVALILFYSTLKKMPLASAGTIQYLAPIFTVIAAIWLNKQKPKGIQWFYFILAFAGVVLIKGFDERVSVLWLIIGIVAAAFAGLSYNATIRCKGTDHPMTIVMYLPLIALPIGGLWCLFDWVNPAPIEWLLLFVMGVFTLFAQYLMTLALHSDVASRITPWNYTGAIFALAIGYFVFDEQVNMLTLVGIVLVATGVILNARVKMESL
ncbi:MAG: DMT family transporter [Flavobacteriales bacterium]|nr:DMT family transporter [Flavobacteriales bacterium]